MKNRPLSNPAVKRMMDRLPDSVVRKFAYMRLRESFEKMACKIWDALIDPMRRVSKAVFGLSKACEKINISS